MSSRMLAKELRAVAAQLRVAQDRIIEAHTNSDNSIGGEAFAEALRITLDMRGVLEGEAEKLEGVTP